MSAANSLLYSDILFFKSSKLTFPFSSQAMTITFIPAITALAALVPWALEGIKQIVLFCSPLLSK